MPRYKTSGFLKKLLCFPRMTNSIRVNSKCDCICSYLDVDIIKFLLLVLLTFITLKNIALCIS